MASESFSDDHDQDRTQAQLSLMIYIQLQIVRLCLQLKHILFFIFFEIDIFQN